MGVAATGAGASKLDKKVGKLGEPFGANCCLENMFSKLSCLKTDDNLLKYDNLCSTQK